MLWLAEGAVTLTAVGLLAPHLTADNHADLLNSARHKDKREVEHLVAEIHPRPDVPSSIRKLPAPKPPSISPAETVETRPGDGPHTSSPDSKDGHESSGLIQAPSKARAVVAPLAPERYKVQFTVDRETFEKLRRAQDLLRHSIPNGDPAAVFDRALTLLLAELNRTRLGSTRSPRRNCPSATSSRHIPAAVKRAVWTRDDGRCAFVGNSGRCAETGFLQFHHLVPYASGGPAVVENIELRCAAHNAHEAEMYFGGRQPALVRESAPLYILGQRRLGPDRVPTFMPHVALVPFMAMLAACQFSENRYLTREVSSTELVGNWQATEFGIKSLRDVGVRDHLTVREHTIVLRADGSCALRTIMNMPLLEDADYRTYDTGCRWRLGDGGHQALRFDLTPAPSVGTPYYYFAEEDGRLLLWQYVADPDRWLYMEFEKGGG